MPKHSAETLIQDNQVSYKRYFEVPVPAETEHIAKGKL
jgi:hypothetical protein